MMKREKHNSAPQSESLDLRFEDRVEAGLSGGPFLGPQETSHAVNVEIVYTQSLLF